MQLVPLQDLDVVFLQIKAAGEHPGDVAIAIHRAWTAEQFDHAAILAEFHGAILLRDEVGVIFGAHGWGA